jgi:hypothetical protein
MIKLKFNINRFAYGRQSKFDLDLSGSGTIDDPYLIEIIETFNEENLTSEYDFTLSDSIEDIKFNRIKIRALYLKNSKNITISNAKLRNLILQNCSNISIGSSIMTKRLRMSDVTQINISKCQIYNLSAISGKKILIQDSDVKHISKNSKANMQFLE